MTRQTLLRLLPGVLAALYLPTIPMGLFALQGVGSMDFEALVFVLSVCVVHPLTLMGILVASFGSITPKLRTYITSLILVHIALFGSVYILISLGLIRGDAFIPLLFSVPSAVFLLSRFAK